MPLLIELLLLVLLFDVIHEVPGTGSLQSDLKINFCTNILNVKSALGSERSIIAERARTELLDRVLLASK